MAARLRWPTAFALAHYATPSSAQAAAAAAGWRLLGSDSGCRLDSTDATLDGKGTVTVHDNVVSLQHCMLNCQLPDCRGVEYSAEDLWCTVWTQPIGATTAKPGYECWAYTPSEPQTEDGPPTLSPGSKQASGQQARTYLPAGTGCWAIGDRALCCQYKDARLGTDYLGQDCIASKPGVLFNVFNNSVGAVCQPGCWVAGACGDAIGVNQWNRAADCSTVTTSTTPSPAGRVALPGGSSCSSVVDRAACCQSLDGRADAPYGGQVCAATRPGVSFDVADAGADTVCEPYCWAAGTCGDGYNQLDRMADCAALTRSTTPGAQAPTSGPTAPATQPTSPPAVTTAPPPGRIPVPHGQGCYAIADRAECCKYTDGRSTDKGYSGEECVPSAPGKFFHVAAPDAQVVCQRRCWTLNTCGDGGPQSDRVGSCGGAVPTPSPEQPAWHLLGADAACRVSSSDMTPDGQGTVEVHDNVVSLLHCQLNCQVSQCYGVEYTAKQLLCRVWTRPIGATVAAEGVECWAFREGPPTPSPAPAPPTTAPPANSTPTAAPVPAPPPAPSKVGVVEQGEFQIPIGGEVRFYAVGSSNAAWQTWPDHLHVMLKDLGYNVNMGPLNVPGATTWPSKAPQCDDEARYRDLVTPRLGMVGWASWGFAFDDKTDCDVMGFRRIAGYPVSCTNGWACNPAWTGKVDLVPISAMAQGVRDGHFVMLANWINDGKLAATPQTRAACYNSADIDFMGSAAVTQANIKSVIHAIHAVNPDVVILVLARYADTQGIVYPSNTTLQQVLEINAALEESLRDESNTYFVDYSFPMGEEMFQTLSKVHPNCRGDKVMATAVLDALFRHNVLQRGLALGDAARCLGHGGCEGLDIPCCQTSALCYVKEGKCAPYSAGKQ